MEKGAAVWKEDEPLQKYKANASLHIFVIDENPASGGLRSGVVANLVITDAQKEFEANRAAREEARIRTKDGQQIIGRIAVNARIAQTEILDASGLYDGAEARGTAPQLPEYLDTFFADELEKVTTRNSLLAAFDVSEVLNETFLKVLSESTLPEERQVAIIREMIDALPAALTRESRTKRGEFVLRGRSPASFRATVEEFADSWTARITDKGINNREAVPIPRSVSRAYLRAPLIIKKPDRELRTSIPMENKTIAEANAFYRKLKRDAHQYIFSQSDGNGIAAFFIMLAMERAKRWEEKEQATRQQLTIVPLDPPQEEDDEEGAEEYKPTRDEMKSGWHPDGPEVGDFTIPANIILERMGLETKGPQGTRNRETIRQALIEMSRKYYDGTQTRTQTVIDKNKRGQYVTKSTTGIFDFVSSFSERTKRGRAPVELWAFQRIDKTLYLPLDLTHGSSYNRIDLAFIPAIYEKAESLTTAARIVKTALQVYFAVIHAEGREIGNARRTGKEPPELVEVKDRIDRLFLETHQKKPARDRQLAIIAEALKVEGISFKAGDTFYTASRRTITTPPQKEKPLERLPAKSAEKQDKRQKRK